MSLDPTFIYANYAEACLWAGFAAAALIKRNAASWLLAGAFLAFGISDIVETYTGAWYRPWWLLAWKSVCVLLILMLGVSLLRKRRCPSTPA